MVKADFDAVYGHRTSMEDSPLANIAVAAATCPKWFEKCESYEQLKPAIIESGDDVVWIEGELAEHRNGHGAIKVDDTTADRLQTLVSKVGRIGESFAGHPRVDNLSSRVAALIIDYWDAIKTISLRSDAKAPVNLGTVEQKTKDASNASSTFDRKS